MDWYSNPPLWLAIILVAIGFYMLIKGADVLVEGAIVIANRFGMTPAVVGATVVAFGTSLPELVVSLGANIKGLAAAKETGIESIGPAAIAISNVVGSNIFNIGAILGITAIIFPFSLPKASFKLDYPIMIMALLALTAFSYLFDRDPMLISRSEGFLLFMCLLAFTYFTIKLGKSSDEDMPNSSSASLGSSIAKIVFGIALLGFGGDISLNGAISIANELGMSERVIGLTVMAIGTSLPELATSIQAVRKGHSDIAVGNVIGSNIFNVFCIIGISSMVLPLPVPEATLSWDFPWMIGINLLILPIFLFFQKVSRASGAFLFSVLSIYITLLLIQ